MANKTARLFNYRPLTVIGLILAIHTLSYGVGYLIPTSGFASSVLYSALGAFVFPSWVGIFLTVLGLYSFYAWIKDSERDVAISSYIMSFYWLFAAMCYFVVGAIGQGIGVGLVWCLLSGYTAFAYKNRQETVEWSTNQKFKKILCGEVDDDPRTMLH